MCRFLALLFVFGSCLTAIADDAKPGIPLRVAVDSTLKIITGETEPVTIRARAEFDYRLEHTGDLVISSIDRLSIDAESEGKELIFAEMNRSGMTSRRNGLTEKVVPTDHGGEMLAQFGAPLMEIKVDPEGAEIGRELKVKSGPLTQSNAVENTRIFHPRFATKGDEWDAPSVLALGQGQTARGTLHYKKRSARKDGLVDVDVSGKLSVNGKIGPAEIKHGDYTVKGVQTYDPALHEWVEGKLDVQMDFEAIEPKGTVVKGSGPVTLTLSRIDPKKKAPKNP